MNHEQVTVRRALLSVWDKSGLIPLARGLADLDVEILSTGGTRKALEEAGIPVIDVAAYTGSPELMEGRVKTLHPRVHAGLLARRDHPGDMAELQAQGWGTIDLVAVNLYPFVQQAVDQGLEVDQACGWIDIGGPTMLRAAAKNPTGVISLCDPRQYEEVLEVLRRQGGVPLALSRRLAAEVFARTSAYDAAVAAYLGSRSGTTPEGEQGGGDPERFPAVLNPRLERVGFLRYGENPHQRAAFYRDPLRTGPNLADCEQLGGKELSFNNLLDLESALGIPLEFDIPACAIIKHTNPSGVGADDSLLEAYQAALATDPVSAFGGLAGFNRPVDPALAEALAERFYEAVIAPGYAPEALALLQRKGQLRIMRYHDRRSRDQEGALDYKRVYGGLLVQDLDAGHLDPRQARLVSRRAPSESEMAALSFAWRVVKWVKSNAIVYAAPGRTLAIGAGQMSRLDSAEVGVRKAGRAGLELAGCVLASDAFFPFRDAVDAAAEAGVRAIVQPGGSVRDQEVIDAADEHGLAMVFTGMRHFRH